MTELDIEITLRYTLMDAYCDFLFNIHAAETKSQSVVAESLYINGCLRTDLQAQFIDSNRWLRLRAESGALNVHYAAIVAIDHFMQLPASLEEVSVGQLPSDVLVYLLPSRYCQSDQLQDFALREFGQVPAGHTRVQAIAIWVNQRVTFRPQTSGVATSAMETLTQQVGVCRDFAHLMIALCRAMTIPARFTTGIDYGADLNLGPPDFHAYVEVYLSGRWYIFDPSGLTVPMGLMRLGTGRDAADVPFATIYGTVQSALPEIAIAAVADPARNVFVPYHAQSALSTDG